MRSIKIPTLEEYRTYKGAHSHLLWKEVGHNWVCPSCKRNKYQLLRWTTRNPGKPSAYKDWIAVLHKHHDHSVKIIASGIRRFSASIICDQCNSADGAAKRMLNLPQSFSFAPHEIAQFISATPHSPHKINHEIARAIYQSIVNIA